MLRSRLASAPAASHRCCFRTDAEGRISLTRDWPRLLDGMAQLDRVALQTRHTFARLIHLGAFPALAWDPTRTLAHDEDGSLHLRCGSWGASWGHLAMCDCCDSPGFLEIQNARGGEIMQICAPPGSEPGEWADCLAPLVAGPAADFGGNPAAGFPVLPDEVDTLAADAEALPDLLVACGREYLSLRAALRTPEITHVREFIPHQVRVDYPLITTGDPHTTLQLATPPVQGLALTPNHTLLVAGPANTLLLSLRPAHATGLAAWHRVLRAAFPTSI